MTGAFGVDVRTPDVATLTVIGVDLGDPMGALSASARHALQCARLVAGGRWHLDALGDLLDTQARVRELAGDLTAVLDEVAAFAGPAVVLASGDPGFFGVLRALRARGRGGAAAWDRLRVEPAVSSVARVAAAAGVPWDDALVVSAHGRDPRFAVNVCRRHPKVVVLTSPDFGPAQLAAVLPDRDLVVAERLGLPDARITRVPSGAVPPASADPNVVLVVDPAAQVSERRTMWPARQGPVRWALPEAALDHRAGMITKAEVRALALAWLAPGIGDLTWDVGAGSGAVAVECSRFGAAVIAVERDADQRERIRANSLRYEAPVQIVDGVAPAALEALPDPDAVFIGGGGDDLPAILAAVSRRRPRVIVVALAAVDRIAGARETLVAAGYDVDGTLLHAARFAPLGDASRLAATNPVFLLHGRPAP